MEPLRTPFDTPPDFGDAVEVAEGVLWLRLPLPMALDHVNVYALAETDGWTVIDTGFSSRKTKAIWETLLAGPLRGKPVRRVLVTHHHPDHIGLAGWFAARGAELITTRTAWLYARMLCLDEQTVPSAEQMLFWQRAGMDTALLAARGAARPFNFCDVVAPLSLGFTRIKADDKIELGGRHWHVRIGDGHAPEHATLWSAEDDLVIGGDQLLPSISANIGVYATEPEADPLHDWLESCARLGRFANDRQLVLPGHKLPFTGLPLRLRQMSENHHSALDRLLASLTIPQTAVDCFTILFRRAIGDAEYGLALVEAVAHLNYLLRQGRVRRSLGAKGEYLWQRM